jgi:hypothetical protein
MTMRTDSTRSRDAALRRLRNANRWLIAASVAATGVLTEVAAQAFPGRTIKTSAATRAVRSGSAGGSAARGKPTPLRPPAQAPESSASSESSNPSESSAPNESSPPAGEASGEAASPAQGTPPAEGSGQAPEAVVSGGS